MAASKQGKSGTVTAETGRWRALERVFSQMPPPRFDVAPARNDFADAIAQCEAQDSRQPDRQHHGPQRYHLSYDTKLIIPYSRLSAGPGAVWVNGRAGGRQPCGQSGDG